MASALAGAAIAVAFCWSRVDWSLVQAVPGAFWAALIVGPLTFFGVLLTNQSHDRRATAQIAAEQDRSDKQMLHDADRLALQLRHAADEAKLEREADMRRDVYLESAAEIVKVNAFVGSMFKLDLEKPESLLGLNAFAAANAKLQVVADQETAIEAQRLSMLYANLAILATPVAQKAYELHVRSNAYQAQAAGLKAKLDGLEEEEEVSPATEPDEWLSRMQQMRHVREQLIKALGRWAEESERVTKARSDYELFLRPHLAETSDQAIRVLARLRKELGLNTDVDSMLSEAQQQRSDMFTRVDELMSAIGARPRDE